MRVVKMLAVLAAVLVVLLVFQHQKDDRTEKAQLACVQSFQARSHGMIADAVDTDAFCACVAQVASQAENPQYDDIQPCMEQHIKPAILSTCSGSIGPRLRADLGIALDCGCMYQEMAGLMWKFYSEKRTLVSPEEEEDIGKNLIRTCGRSLAP